MGKTQITAEPGLPMIVVEREFDAPRELLLRAHTDPELLVQWMGPRDLTTTIEEFDVRHGGRWRYVATDPDGNEFRFRGVFHGEPSLDGLVQTFEFEGAPGHVAMDTLVLVDRDGRTLVRTITCFQSVEDRDAMLASGAEVGINDSHARMEELLARLRAG